MCANLVDPAPVDAARGRSPATVGMLVEHGPLHVVCDCDAAPGLSTEHGPLRAAHDHGSAIVTTPSLSTRHGRLRAARGHGPAVAIGLRWTCGPDNSASGQRQTACSRRRHS